jgi:hypothetical protein
MIRPFDFPVTPSVYTKHEQIGIFDKLYEIEGLSRRECNVLAKWLCQNCTQNFIMLELSSFILAGGTSDIRNSFAYRSANRSDLHCKHLVKLHDPDVILFELCWLTASNTMLYS